MTGQDDLLSPELPSSPIGTEFSGGRLPLGLSSLASHLDPRGILTHDQYCVSAMGSCHAQYFYLAHLG